MKMFINHGIYRIHGMMVSITVLFGFVGLSYAGAVEATSPVFGLSVKHDGVRQSAGAETLTYSSQWDGGEGATVTIAENGAVVADGLTGEGTRPWSVQKTGEYTLTHTTYTNGIAGKVETATFVVPGPELTFEYDGGPFVGGKVTINGNLDGWTIYYTLDGSIPTTESLKYIGPFTLSSAANLKAYAVSDSGMSTPLIENNYAVVERARIENVRARQRWPWNGKVDIDFNVVGDVTLGASADLQPYLVVTAKEIDTGLTYTITSDDKPLTGNTGTEEGHHRVTWDLDAHGLDIDSSNVEFTVTYQTVPLYCIINIPEDATGVEHVTYMNASPVDGFNNGNYKKEKIVLRRIENGTFNLGKQYKVTLTQPYYMAMFETTIGQYVRFMGRNIAELLDPWYDYGDSQPIHRLSYNEIRGWSSNWPISSDVESGTIISKLRWWTGISTLDLPTEAEWEYACRAGTISDFNDGSMLTGKEYDTNLSKLGYYYANSRNICDLYPVYGVGGYKPNAWGLYDMHGNAIECCLDYFQKDLVSGIDPKGPESGMKGYRVTRGGGVSPAEACSSFNRGYDDPRTGYCDDVGFRLCLKLTDSHLVNLTNVFITGVSDVARIDARKETRISLGDETLTYSSQWDGGDGATVTIAENGRVLAEGVSGEGTRPWRVQKTGEYMLTHTTYTNGIAGKIEAATFVVPGPELTFEYDGGPFVGGKVTINGNLEGWTIYYTLDGSTPTTESLKYTGPFTLSSAANLKAYAVSDSGISTLVFENDYAVVERARIENVRARQRWPWNGKVDIDSDVIGSAGVSYGVVLSVTDTIGGTNLTMRTVTTSDGAAINPTGAKVIPGQYRWTWDAAADLSDGFVSDAISINVDVLGDGVTTYFVRFNANEGEGAMNDELFINGVEKSLPSNMFKRDGYMFGGWAISSNGKKIYDDRHRILNLSKNSGAIINLYATWIKDCDKVQLWEDGPYWATTNIGAEKPEDYGYYFWWGDTVGYKREMILIEYEYTGGWVASNESVLGFSFKSSNAPTYNKDYSELQKYGRITEDGVLSSEYDAAHVQWGGEWRIPTKQEFDDLISKCDWTWTTLNGVKGYIVQGKGVYSSKSIFLPCAGRGNKASLDYAGSYGYYWSSLPDSDYDYNAWSLYFYSNNHSTGNSTRSYGQSVRPLQSSAK